MKRGRLDLSKAETAKRLGIVPNTLKKVETGDYDAPKEIYRRVMDWLLED